MLNRTKGKGGAILCSKLLRMCYSRAERQKGMVRCRHTGTAIGKKPVTNNFRLLFKAVATERATLNYMVAIATERMSHQGKVETTTLLRLKDMDHLMNEQTLATERLVREIVGPKRAVGVEMDVAGWCHDHITGLERPPFSPEDADAAIVDGVPEDGAGQRDLAAGQRTTFFSPAIACFHGAGRRRS